MKRRLLFLTFLTAFLCGCSSGDGREEADRTAVDTLPQLIIQVQQCSRLYTAEYHIHKIVTHDDVVRLKGNVLGQEVDMKMPLGERKIAIPMDATLKAYIDLSTFSEQNIERHGEQIVITLPDPQVTLTSSKIDQRNIREYIGLVRSHFSDAEMSNYEQQGREAILESVPQLGIIGTAQENAARVLVPLITQLGYKEENITIRFRKQFSAQDIKTLINTNLEK